MSSKPDITILVNSCDFYEDAWEPFFRLLNLFWKDCPYDIVLNTETKQYHCDFMTVKTINSGIGKSWTGRVRYALEQINTKYVLFALEDFFLLGKVNTDIFNLAVELLEKDSKIGLITFLRKKMNMKFPEKDNLDKCFRLVSNKEKNRANIFFALWRKEYFLKLIPFDEDPWTYEKEASIRSQFAGYKILTQDYNFSSPVFHYCMDPKDGYGITQGKWLIKNKPFFESKGIFGVNYNRLGMFDETTSYEQIREEYINGAEKRKAKRKKEIEALSGIKKIKEILYDKVHFIKTKFRSPQVSYIKKCVYYWFYYKIRN